MSAAYKCDGCGKLREGRPNGTVRNCGVNLDEEHHSCSTKCWLLLDYRRDRARVAICLADYPKQSEIAVGGDL